MLTDKKLQPNYTYVLKIKQANGGVTYFGVNKYGVVTYHELGDIEDRARYLKDNNLNWEDFIIAPAPGYIQKRFLKSFPEMKDKLSGLEKDDLEHILGKLEKYSL